MSDYLKAGDTISAREGSVFVTIDGRNVPLLQIQNIEANIDFTKAELTVLSHKMNQHRPVGATGAGSATMYKTTSEFAKIAIDFIKTGAMPEMTMKLTNADTSSTKGRQTVLLTGVLFDSLNLAKLDTDSELLDEDADFTFNNADLLEQFTA